MWCTTQCVHWSDVSPSAASIRETRWSRVKEVAIFRVISPLCTSNSGALNMTTMNINDITIDFVDLANYSVMSVALSHLSSVNSWLSSSVKFAVESWFEVSEIHTCMCELVGVTKPEHLLFIYVDVHSPSDYTNLKYCMWWYVYILCVCVCVCVCACVCACVLVSTHRKCSSVKGSGLCDGSGILYYSNL